MCVVLLCMLNIAECCLVVLSNYMLCCVELVCCYGVLCFCVVFMCVVLCCVGVYAWCCFVLR